MLQSSLKRNTVNLSFGSYKRKETKRLLEKRQLIQVLQRDFGIKKWLQIKKE
jgi:hypothetical protein